MKETKKHSNIFGMNFLKSRVAMIKIENTCKEESWEWGNEEFGLKQSA